MLSTLIGGFKEYHLLVVRFGASFIFLLSILWKPFPFHKKFIPRFLFLSLLWSSPMLLVWSHQWPTPKETRPSPNGIALVSFNGRYLDGLPYAACEALQTAQPDLLMVQEATTAMVDTLEVSFGSQLPFRLLHPHPKYGMATYSQYPIQLDTAICAPGINKSWHYVQIFQVCPPEGASFRIVHVRLPSASAIFTSKQGWLRQMNYQQHIRQIYWDLITEVLRKLPPLPTWYLGDFNTYPGSPLYYSLLDTHMDAVAGSPYFFQGTLGTKLSWMPPLFRVDWAFGPPESQVSDFRHLSVPNSDHKAIAFSLLN
ncbi:MAG: endonuclease/exonuclease/phosphatase family protein [Bacteroidota bacterium]